MNRLHKGFRDAPLAPGAYLSADHGGDGAPIELFLYDPPILLSPTAMERLGAKPIERAHPGAPERRMRPSITSDGARNVVEWLTQREYLNVADWVEEARRVGVHRPCGLTPEEIVDLRPGSTLMLAHSKGHLRNWRDYGPLRRDCPKRVSGHASGETPAKLCCGYWWQDLEGGYASGEGVHRAAHMGTYPGWSPPERVEPKYQPAMVARVPIGGVTVVGYSDRRTQQEQALMDAAEAAGLFVRTIEP